MTSSGPGSPDGRKRPADDTRFLRRHGSSTSRGQPFKAARTASFGTTSWFAASEPPGGRIWSGSVQDVGLTELDLASPASTENRAYPPSRQHLTLLEESSPLYGSGLITSPETLSTFDDYAANSRFLELQEELRSILFTGVQSLAPSRAQSPEAANEEGLSTAQRQPQKHLDLSRTTIPLKRKIEYLKVWTSECAPWLDMFDASRHFGIQAPIMAQSSPALLYGILALSARQYERKQRLEGSYDSIQLYQESISLLTPILEAKDPNVLVTACILCCLEMMSVNPRDWRRHVEGCAALFESFNINGFSGGLLQAVFWCYARMDLCGAIISDGTKSTVLPIARWAVVPESSPLSGQLTVEQQEQEIRKTFLSRGRLVPDMHANYAVYLCAKTCDLVCRRTRHLELNERNDCQGTSFQAQWVRLWEELQIWTTERPPEMLPIKSTSSKGSSHRERGKGQQLFPEILFAHWAAISSNQLYHTACIMMLEIKPPSITNDLRLQSSSSQQPCDSPVWHARRICGISLTNPHRGCLNNAIQPLFIAGRLLSHRSEHIAVVKLIRTIEETTGWGACWRLKDLERAWGYDRNDLSNIP